MLTLRWVLLLSVVYMATSAADLVAADAPPALSRAERRLPKDTLAFVTIPNVEQFRQNWSESSWGAIAADPAFKEFIDDALLRFSDRTGGLGLNLPGLWKHVDGELALALVQNADFELSLVAIADFAEDTESAQHLAQRIDKQWEYEGAQSTTIHKGDVELRAWHRGPAAREKKLAYFVDGGQVVLTTGLPMLLELTTDSMGQETDSLADNPDYRHVVAQSGGSPGAARWYVNPTRLLDAAVTENLRGNPNLELIRSLVSSAGLDQLIGGGGTFDLGAGDLDSAMTTYGYVKQPVTGILKAFEMPATEQRPPNWVKDDVSLYAQMNWSPARFFETVAGFVDGVRGAGAFDESIGSMRVGSTDYTYRDVIQQLSGSLHVAAEIPAGANDLTRQPAILAFEVADPVLVQQMVSEIAKASQVAPRAVSGDDMYEINLPVPIPGGQSMQLGVAVADGALMVSTNADYLARTLQSRETKRPLAESRAYRRVAEQFPERTAMISFQQQDGRFEGLYESLRSGNLDLAGITSLPGITGQLLGFDFSKLPPFSAMSRYLQSTGSYIEPAEDGFRMVNFALPPRER